MSVHVYGAYDAYIFYHTGVEVHKKIWQNKQKNINILGVLKHFLSNLYQHSLINLIKSLRLNYFMALI